jgi:hypothetical protein
MDYLVFNHKWAIGELHAQNERGLEAGKGRRTTGRLNTDRRRVVVSQRDDSYRTFNGHQGERVQQRDGLGVLLRGSVSIPGQPILEPGRGIVVWRVEGSITAVIIEVVSHIRVGVMIMAMLRIAGVKMIQRGLAEGSQQRQNQAAMEQEPHCPSVWHTGVKPGEDRTR